VGIVQRRIKGEVALRVDRCRALGWGEPPEGAPIDNREGHMGLTSYERNSIRHVRYGPGGIKENLNFGIAFISPRLRVMALAKPPPTRRSRGSQERIENHLGALIISKIRRICLD